MPGKNLSRESFLERAIHELPDSPGPRRLEVLVEGVPARHGFDEAHRVESGGFVALLPEHGRERGHVAGERVIVNEADAMSRRVESRQNRRERLPRSGCGGERALEEHAVRCQPVEGGCGRSRVAVGPDVVGPEGVDDGDDDRRAFGLSTAAGERREESREGKQSSERNPASRRGPNARGAEEQKMAGQRFHSEALQRRRSYSGALSITSAIARTVAPANPGVGELASRPFRLSQSSLLRPLPAEDPEWNAKKDFLGPSSSCRFGLRRARSLRARAIGPAWPDP
ncbi:MAG: hypothetical protein KatS3mg076_2963 [Candidatus Binatia bacterium]|nr:MAG: hypothetical protein KatS3mg076_2963 [Candidatus Binatia bacterium]